jgi:hypothetical protein
MERNGRNCADNTASQIFSERCLGEASFSASYGPGNCFHIHTPVTRQYSQNISFTTFDGNGAHNRFSALGNSRTAYSCNQIGPTLGRVLDYSKSSVLTREQENETVKYTHHLAPSQRQTAMPHRAGHEGIVDPARLGRKRANNPARLGVNRRTSSPYARQPPRRLQAHSPPVVVRGLV